MITKIKVKNFKSFLEVELDLRKTKKTIKNIALIYGENGAGKSNIISSIYTLQSLFDTMIIRDDLKEIMNKLNEFSNGEKDIEEDFLRYVKTRYKTTEDIIRDSKMIESDANMSIELSFNVNNKEGVYYIETDNDKIVKEKLEYVLNKNKGIYFDIDLEVINSSKQLLNHNIINDDEYRYELNKKIEKFWGKHTLMAILKYDFQDKSENFMFKNLSKNFQVVLDFLFKINYKVKEGNSCEVGHYTAKNKILRDLKHGKVSQNHLEDLINCEKLINEIFTKLYADIKQVYYEKQEKKNSIEYTLYFKKMIGGNLKDINIDKESTGTQQILELLPFLITAIKGGVVFIDEFDSGIHDLMVRAILKNINRYLKGQLILSSHNTKLMEEIEFLDYFYFLTIDRFGNKEICSINDYEKRTYPKNNIRDLYFKGEFDAIPFTVDIDYKNILDTFNI